MSEKKEEVEMEEEKDGGGEWREEAFHMRRE